MIDGTATIGAWLPAALTAFGGFATAALRFLAVRSAAAKKDERIYQREKAARDDGRRDKIIERRNEAQRQALVEIQSVAQRYLRIAGKMNHHDIMQFRKTGEWQKGMFPDGLSDESLELGIQITALIVRVRDEQVRDLIQQMKTDAIKASNSKDENDARISITAASESFSKLNTRIADVLLSLDDVELSEM